MTNAYETLGLSPSFDLSNADLRKAFLKLSAQYHPDRASTDEERESFQAKASEINFAHQSLKNPEHRGNLLLDLLGGPSASEDKSLPPTLLMDMLELKEELEDARASKDKSALAEIQDKAKNDRDVILKKLTGQFSTVIEQESPDSQDLKAIRLTLNELRYIERLIEQSSEDFEISHDT